MKTRVFILSFGFLFSICSIKANDPVVMKVNGKEVLKSEFEYLYKKNNTGIALTEYVDLFKKFKLKVAEAQAQGIDTTAAFINELRDNRNQLAKQYTKDLAIDESVLRKEYERLKEDVEISHLVVPIKPETVSSNDGTSNSVLASRLLPADTLEAYNKAIQYRKRLLKGEKIDKIAAEIEKSFKLPNAAPTYMGWVSAMMMAPSIEDVMYGTSAKSVSMPIRFNSLYLLLQVHAKRPSTGEINASHIMVACPKEADIVQVEDAEKKASEIYERVASGEDFATLAKELSDDKGSGMQGGELGWFGSGRMVKEFETAAFALQNKGDISKPVRSQFGYHIIKLNDTRSIEPFDQKKAQITNFLSRGEKNYELRKPGIDLLKQKANFEANEKAYKYIIDLSEQCHPADSLFKATIENNDDVLFTVWNTPYMLSDFMTSILRSGSAYILSSDIITDKYQAFVFDVLKKENDAHLEDQFDEFKNLMREYHDGFLSYEITQKEVWEKAPKDTLGLINFFNTNRDKYKWDAPRYKGYVVLCKDASTLKNAKKSIKKMQTDDAARYLMKEMNNDSVKLVKVEKGIFSQGSNAYIDELVFKSAKAEQNKDFPEYFVIGKLLKKGPESYSDVGGLVISDYQNFLEQEWLDKLKDKYPIEIFTDVLDTIE